MHRPERRAILNYLNTRPKYGRTEDKKSVGSEASSTMTDNALYALKIIARGNEPLQVRCLFPIPEHRRDYQTLYKITYKSFDEEKHGLIRSENVPGEAEPWTGSQVDKSNNASLVRPERTYEC